MKKIPISTADAPSAIGPYSQAVCAGDTIYVSGQIPIIASTGAMPDGIAEQTAQCLENIKAILSEANCSMDNVVKATVLLQDISDFAAMNEVYARYFSAPYPARAAFEVAALPKGARIEIEVVAVR